jgi:hypothetical protein
MSEMTHRISDKLKTINPWHFLWISVVCSEILTLLLTTVQCYLRWGHLSYDVLIIGVIDSLFVPLLVAPILIYFVLHAAKLEELNKKLQLEIISIKHSDEKMLRRARPATAP